MKVHVAVSPLWHVKTGQKCQISSVRNRKSCVSWSVLVLTHQVSSPVTQRARLHGMFK